MPALKHLTANDKELIKKKKALRQNEYYNMQPTFDLLYALSKKGCNHYNLMDLISSDSNILLAYRKIKRNKGSMTKGTNNSTIQNIADMSEEAFVKMVKNRLNNFHPHSVRRVEIRWCVKIVDVSGRVGRCLTTSSPSQIRAGAINAHGSSLLGLCYISCRY